MIEMNDQIKINWKKININDVRTKREQNEINSNANGTDKQKISTLREKER
jgi:hypothetical protein